MARISPRAAIPRPTITLLTDFGYEDWYVAALKAVLLRHNPAARLVDISHGLRQGDVMGGGIALERALAAFAPETVHLAVVDPGVGGPRRLILANIHRQWVVCPDNGLITWAIRQLGEGPVYELTWRPNHPSATFHGRDILAPAAAALAAGVALTELGRPVSDPVLLPIPELASEGTSGGISGSIIHFDHFGNAITNIPGPAARAQVRARVWCAGRDLGLLRRTYSDVPRSEAVALIGSSELLEIAVRDGSAQRDLGLRVGDLVRLQPPERDTAELRRLDQQHLWHPFTRQAEWLASEPLVITDALGFHLIDSDGNRYLDGVSSLWCNVHGHRVPEIDQAIIAQLGRVAHSTLLGLACEPSILLAERLVKIAPPGLARVFYSDCGAAAVEIALKLAVQYWYLQGHPERREFITLGHAYHGDTFGSMAVGRTPLFHQAFEPLLFPVHVAPSPHVYRPPPALVESRGGWPAADEVSAYCLAEITRLLEQHGPRIAGIVLEPTVQGAAGMIVHPPGFLAAVRDLARRHGTLLICDEVATGFGRTGRMFACEHEGVSPDLLCVAKGITGGYLPLAATLATDRIYQAFVGPGPQQTFYHGHTYTGNALACAAALASLDLLERRQVIAQAAERAEALAGLLAELRELPHVGDIRQKGLMVGIELVEDKPARRPFPPTRRLGHAVCQAVRRHGVILRPLGDTIVLMPPPAMSLDDLRTIVGAVRAALAEMSVVGA